jgi:cytochrome c
MPETEARRDAATCGRGLAAPYGRLATATFRHRVTATCLHRAAATGRRRTAHAALRAVGLLAALLGGLPTPAPAGDPPQAEPVAPRLGRPLDEAAAGRHDLDVFPDGRGLPAGRGTAAEGRAIYAAHCAACHGPRGRGGTAEELAGAEEPLTARTPDKTIGSYWPYATTVFDFLRRAKPMDAPGSFTADELYALTAFLLWANGLVGETDPIDAATLPRLRMPNRDGFVGVDAGRER